MPYYVKVTKEVRDALLSPDVSVTKAKDGNYILYQTALADVKGVTLSERVAYVGGVLLTQLQAKREMSGEICGKCHTPKAYGGSDEPEGMGGIPSAGATDEDNDKVTDSPEESEAAGNSEEDGAADNPEEGEMIDNPEESEVDDE